MSLTEEDQIKIADLVKSSKKGDLNAFGNLFSITEKKIFEFCFFLTHSKSAAEDLLHDTFLKAFRSLHQLNQNEAFLSWIKSIARSIYLDIQKSSYTKTQSKFNLHDHLQQIDSLDSRKGFSFDLTSDQMDVLNTLNELEDHDKLILVLADIQECSYSEIAQTLQIPEGTVKSRLSRARDKFKHHYNIPKINGTKKKSHAS